MDNQPVERPFEKGECTHQLWSQNLVLKKVTSTCLNISFAAFINSSQSLIKVVLQKQQSSPDF